MLSQDQIDQFRDEGNLVVEGALPEADLASVIDEN